MNYHVRIPSIPFSDKTDGRVEKQTCLSIVLILYFDACLRLHAEKNQLSHSEKKKRNRKVRKNPCRTRKEYALTSSVNVYLSLTIFN